MDNKLRVVVVGLGSIGKRHTRLLLERSDIQVEVCELSAAFKEAAFKEFGEVPSHDDFAAMLTTKPEVVWLATPTVVHAEQAVAALNAAAHVFCEKPMTDSVAEAGRICEAVKRNQRILNVGFHLHFHPAIKRMKQTIDSGVLGQIMHIHARVGSYFTLECSVSRHQAYKEGSLMWDYAHQPDILYWLLGKKPTALYACAFQAGDLELSSNPNVVVINCEYDGRLISSIHMNYAQMPQRHEYEIVGDKAWAVLDVEVGNMRVGKREDATTETKTFSTDRDDMYRAEHRAFLETVKGERHPETSAKDGLVSMAVCEAAMKSWKAHEPVKIQL